MIIAAENGPTQHVVALMENKLILLNIRRIVPAQELVVEGANVRRERDRGERGEGKYD